MEYKIKIYEKGRERIRRLFIERVPYKVFLIAQRLEKLTAQVREDSELMLAYAEENKELQETRRDGWKDKVKENNREIKELREKIYAVEDAGFFEERFEAIKVILEANGVKEGDELYNPSLWAESMDYSEPMAFITQALGKDIDKKKLLADAARSISGV